MTRSGRRSFFKWNDEVKYFIWFAGLLLVVLLLFVPFRAIMAWPGVSLWPGKVWKQAWQESETVDDLKERWDGVRRDLRRQGVDVSWEEIERVLKGRLQYQKTVTDTEILPFLQSSEVQKATVWLTVLHFAAAVLFILFVVLPANEMLFSTSSGFKIGIGILGFFIPWVALIVTFALLVKEDCLDTWRKRSVFLACVLAALLVFGIVVS